MGWRSARSKLSGLRRRSRMFDNGCCSGMRFRLGFRGVSRRGYVGDTCRVCAEAKVASMTVVATNVKESERMMEE